MKKPRKEHYEKLSEYFEAKDKYYRENNYIIRWRSDEDYQEEIRSYAPLFSTCMSEYPAVTTAFPDDIFITGINE